MHAVEFIESLPPAPPSPTRPPQALDMACKLFDRYPSDVTVAAPTDKPNYCWSPWKREWVPLKEVEDTAQRTGLSTLPLPAMPAVRALSPSLFSPFPPPPLPPCPPLKLPALIPRCLRRPPTTTNGLHPGTAST